MTLLGASAWLRCRRLLLAMRRIVQGEGLAGVRLPLRLVAARLVFPCGDLFALSARPITAFPTAPSPAPPAPASAASAPLPVVVFAAVIAGLRLLAQTRSYLVGRLVQIIVWLDRFVAEMFVVGPVAMAIGRLGFGFCPVLRLGAVLALRALALLAPMFNSVLRALTATPAPAAPA